MLFPLFALALTGTAAPADLLVSAVWVSRHRTDAAVVILHIAREKEDYDKGHVPGARFLPARTLWTTAAPGVELPTVAVIDSIFESVGVSTNSRIILYGDAWTTPRAFLALDLIGLGDQTAMLDGGLSAWAAAGQPLSTEPAPAGHGSIEPRPRSIVVDADWVKTHTDDAGVTLIDARSPAEYAGTTEVEMLPRYGHIPGAHNVNWVDTFTNRAAADSGRSTLLVPRAQLEKMFAAAGAAKDRQVVTYCTVGFRASHMYFLARLLGYQPKIYDGSMRDWSARTELPLVKSAQPR